jgi:hypothetical protein
MVNEHDPLCSNQPGYFDGSIDWYAKCECVLISKVRADEREKAAKRVANLSSRTAIWPEAKGTWAIIGASLGMAPQQPPLKESCYECAGERPAYDLAVENAAAAARGEAS